MNMENLPISLFFGIDKSSMTIRGETGEHTVVKDENGIYWCSCAYFQYSGKECKHIRLFKKIEKCVEEVLDNEWDKE